MKVKYDGLASSQTMVIPVGKCTVVGCKGEKIPQMQSEIFLIFLTWNFRSITL